MVQPPKGFEGGVREVGVGFEKPHLLRTEHVCVPTHTSGHTFMHCCGGYVCMA